MHRTTTTAALLVTVAVSALSGCVKVQHGAVPGPPGSPSRPSQASAPRPEGSAQPRVVQAPPREALARVGPSPESGTSGPAAPDRTATAGQDAPRGQAPAPGRAQPGPRPHRGPHRDRGASGGARPLPHNPDVCALGKQFGGWDPNSPQATICRQTYGR